jgi:hypothetical protein
MGIERRGDNLYYYRKKRIGDRIISEYVGAGELGRMAAEADRVEREKQSEERLRTEVMGAEIMAEDKVFAEYAGLVNTLVQGLLLAEGYHMHKGQWRGRGKRGES